MIRPRGVITYGPPVTHDHGDWREHALCAGPGNDPDDWFIPGHEGRGWDHPSHAERLADLKAVCRACPVRAECLADAYEQGDKDSVRGGYTPAERERLRRNRKRTSRKASA